MGLRGNLLAKRRVSAILAIATREKFRSTLRDTFKRALNIIAMWASQNGLGVNPTKTKLVLFKRKRTKSDSEPISLRSTVIHFADSAKYLGVLLDKRLNFGLNIMERANKTTVA